MSFDYTTFFTRFGRCISWMNMWVAQQNVLCLASSTGEADNVLTQYETRRDLAPNFQTAVQGQAAAMAGWVAIAKALADTTIADLQSSLNAPNRTVATILPLLSRQMILDSQTIQHNVITAPVVTAGGSNVGNGTLKVSPISTSGNDDERVIDETVQLICTADQFSGGTAGAESFSVVGLPVIDVNTYGPRGSGTGSKLVVSDSVSLLSNSAFTTWTVTNTPDDWNIVAGIAGTNIFQDTATPHSGTSDLKLAGDGSTTTIGLKQVIASSVSSTTVYAAGIWLRKSGTVSGGSTLAITIKGTGAATKTVISIDPSTLTTSYVLYTLFFATESTVPPSDYRFDISWTSANSAGASAVILIANAVLVAPARFGNCGYALFRGSTDFVKGDSISVATAVTSAGVFQTALARWYGLSLPSSGSPSISDTLAA